MSWSLKTPSCVPPAATLLTFFILALSTAALFAQDLPQSAQSRIQGPILDSDVVTLLGNTHPQARPENDRGVVAPETRLDRLVLLLEPGPARQRQLDTLTEAQQQTDSPLYHRWLTPEEYGSRFGLADSDLARVAAWLESHGFHVDEIPASRRLILFSGTAGQVEEAFHAPIHRYAVQSVNHLANADDPQIPRALSSVVAGVVSLHDFRRNAMLTSSRAIASKPTNSPANPQDTEGSNHYLFPADFATIYNLDPLYKTGNNGAGIAIAIVGRSNINLDDISTFRSFAALSANQPAIVLDGPNPGLVSGDQAEATLDVEWAGAVAPAATVKFVVAASTATSDGVDLSAQYIVNHKTAPVMSTSFGNCEAHMGATEMAFYNSLWQQAAAEGISAFVSSGDSGAAGCEGGSATKGSTAAVNGLCSSPWSTCVGGTEFEEGTVAGKYWAPMDGAGGSSALGYIPEAVWNESSADGGSGLWASGGGISGVYPQPSWQRGISGASSNGMRAVPDVALTSAAHDGYLVYLNNSWYSFAGTSAASPSFAGILALVLNKQSPAAQAAGLGNVNPALYAMLSANANPFHATLSGNNSVAGAHGFTASGAAYNLATGLGSVDANVLAGNWPSATGAVAQGFTLTPSVKVESVSAGATATFTVAVAAAGGFSGPVALTAKAPTGVTVTFTPAIVKPGSVSTVTLTVPKTAMTGTLTITGSGANASGIALTQSASVALTIMAAAKHTLSVTVASTSLRLVKGKSAASQVTIDTANSFADAITLSVSGLPRGVLAAWSANPVRTAGTTGKGTSVLTLTATSQAAAKANITVTASGGGVSATQAVTVQVAASTLGGKPLTAASKDGN